jgi:gamma-glutamyltranspeptidase/glutathione hydrolase
MGAFMQPQGQVQTILNMKHFKSNPQHALDLPRICVAPPKSSPGASGNAYTFTDVTQSSLFLEDGISEEVIEELRAKGHTCHSVKGYERALFGRGQIIRSRIDPRTGHKVLAAGSDPRADGHATGW